jgi:hypothetical protein
MGSLAALLLALLTLLTWRQSRRPLRGRAFMLFRSLLPSWRFFEDVEPGPELRFAVAARDRDFGPWQPALAPGAGTRGWLLNAQGNLHLARQSLIEQLWSELDGVAVAAAPELVSYRLVQRLIESRARELGLMSEGARYRFRLLGGATDSEPDFESEEHSF